MNEQALFYGPFEPGAIAKSRREMEKLWVISILWLA